MLHFPEANIGIRENLENFYENEAELMNVEVKLIDFGYLVQARNVNAPGQA